MEVSEEIKEEIRKTQYELRHAIRLHQVWVARLQEDLNNPLLKSKVQEAEKEIIMIGQNQKRVVDRLRQELELYQLRLKSRNKQINLQNDNLFIAQQLRDHLLQFRNKHRQLLKPTVLTENYIKHENGESKTQNNVSDSDSELKSMEKVNSNSCENGRKEKEVSVVHNDLNTLADALKVRNSFNSSNDRQHYEWQMEQKSDSETSSSNAGEMTPSPSPPLMPGPGEALTKENFLRHLGLVSHHTKDIIEKRRSERRKRKCTVSSKNEFVYGNFDSIVSKRKKCNQFPYLQNHSGPPQTRAAKVRKQKKQGDKSASEVSSREPSPLVEACQSPVENKEWVNHKLPFAINLPPSLTIEPVLPPKKVCHSCGENDVPSLLVWCSSCGVHQHTACGEAGCCVNCSATLPDPAELSTGTTHVVRDKLQQRQQLQEKNMKLCVELQKLLNRASALKDRLDDKESAKQKLLAIELSKQHDLKKLLDFVAKFKETPTTNAITEVGNKISISK